MKKLIPKLLLFILIPTLLTFGLAKFAPTPQFDIEKVNAGFAPFRIIQGGSLKNDNTSYSFDGDLDRLSVDDHANWILGGGTGAFTIEYWVFAADVGEANAPFYIDQRTDGNNRYSIFNESAAPRFFFRDSSTTHVDITSSQTMSNSTWHHVAVTRSGNTWTVWLDGTDRGNASVSATVGDYTGTLNIADNEDNRELTGNMDEIRISNVARYTSSFTPQVSEFRRDSNTHLLIHCGEVIASGTTGSGATSVESSNTRHTVTEQNGAIRDTSTFKL